MALVLTIAVSAFTAEEASSEGNHRGWCIGVGNTHHRSSCVPTTSGGTGTGTSNTPTGTPVTPTGPDPSRPSLVTPTNPLPPTTAGSYPVPYPVPQLAPLIAPHIAPQLQPVAVPPLVPVLVPQPKPPLAPSLAPQIVPPQPPLAVPLLRPVLVPQPKPPLAPSLAPQIVPPKSPSAVPSLVPVLVLRPQPLATPLAVPQVVPSPQPVAVPQLVPQPILQAAQPRPQGGSQTPAGGGTTGGRATVTHRPNAKQPADAHQHVTPLAGRQNPHDIPNFTDPVRGGTVDCLASGLQRRMHVDARGGVTLSGAAPHVDIGDPIVRDIPAENHRHAGCVIKVKRRFRR